MDNLTEAEFNVLASVCRDAAGTELYTIPILAVMFSGLNKVRTAMNDGNHVNETQGQSDD